MITTIYKCDCCGHEQNDKEQMWEMVVNVKDIARTIEYALVTKRQLWCRVCVEKIGLLPMVETKPEEVKEITFEELVRKIVQEEMEANV